MNKILVAAVILILSISVYFFRKRIMEGFGFGGTKVIEVSYVEDSDIIPDWKKYVEGKQKPYNRLDMTMDKYYDPNITPDIYYQNVRSGISAI